MDKRLRNENKLKILLYLCSKNEKVTAEQVHSYVRKNDFYTQPAQTYKHLHDLSSNKYKFLSHIRNIKNPRSQQYWQIQRDIGTFRRVARYICENCDNFENIKSDFIFSEYFDQCFRKFFKRIIYCSFKVEPSKCSLENIASYKFLIEASPTAFKILTENEVGNFGFVGKLVSTFDFNRKFKRLNKNLIRYDSYRYNNKNLTCFEDSNKGTVYNLKLNFEDHLVKALFLCLILDQIKNEFFTIKPLVHLDDKSFAIRY